MKVTTFDKSSEPCWFWHFNFTMGPMPFLGTNMFRYLRWRNPEPYVRLFLGVGLPYISLTTCSFYRWGFLHFRYLKCFWWTYPLPRRFWSWFSRSPGKICIRSLMDYFFSDVLKPVPTFWNVVFLQKERIKPKQDGPGYKWSYGARINITPIKGKNKWVSQSVFSPLNK